jgi:hypothetical protein
MDANASAKPASAMPVSITAVRRFMTSSPLCARLRERARTHIDFEFQDIPPAVAIALPFNSQDFGTSRWQLVITLHHVFRASERGSKWQHLARLGNDLPPEMGLIIGAKLPRSRNGTRPGT